MSDKVERLDLTPSGTFCFIFNAKTGVSIAIVLSMCGALYSFITATATAATVFNFILVVLHLFGLHVITARNYNAVLAHSAVGYATAFLIIQTISIIFAAVYLSIYVKYFKCSEAWSSGACESHIISKSSIVVIIILSNIYFIYVVGDYCYKLRNNILSIPAYRSGY